MAQQISKFDINPSTGKQYGVNPNTGVQDDNYWAQQVDPVVNKDFYAQRNQQQQAQTAQTNYQAGIGSAVSSLQTQGTNLDSQYSDLLGKIMQQGSGAVTTTTGAANVELTRRGITPNSLLYGQTMGSAIAPIEAQFAGAEAGAGSSYMGLKQELANNIASIQAGGAGTMAGLPLSYGSLALSSAANLANIAQAGSTALATGVGAHLISVPGFGLYNVDTGQFQQSYGTTGTPGTVNGVGGLWIP